MPHDVERSCNFLRKSPINQILYTQMDFKYGLNRYRRGLETCPQAKTSKVLLLSSLFSNASKRRVRLSAESKILASTFGRFRLYRLKFICFKLWLNISIFLNVLARLLILEQSKTGSIEF